VIENIRQHLKAETFERFAFIASREPRRALTLLSLFFLTVVFAPATSLLFTLEQKVAASKMVLRVGVTEAAPPVSKNVLDPAVCNAKVLEVLKGTRDLKEVQFRFHAYASGSFSRDRLPDMVGQEYLVFLHEPPATGRPPGERWVFQGPAGIRPIAKHYEEYRISPQGAITKESLSYDNFIAAIRTYASQGGSKKE